MHLLAPWRAAPRPPREPAAPASEPAAGLSLSVPVSAEDSPSVAPDAESPGPSLSGFCAPRLKQHRMSTALAPHNEYHMSTA